MTKEQKCKYGLEDCIFIDKEHDEDSCFNGIYEHIYICQNCGYSTTNKIYSKILKPDGFYKIPEFRVKDCPECKGKKSLV